MDDGLAGGVDMLVDLKRIGLKLDAQNVSPLKSDGRHNGATPNFKISFMHFS